MVLTFYESFNNICKLRCSVVPIRQKLIDSLMYVVCVNVSMFLYICVYVCMCVSMYNVCNLVGTSKSGPICTKFFEDTHINISNMGSLVEQNILRKHYFGPH